MTRDIEALTPTLRRGVRELMRRAAAQGLSVVITGTYRTHEEQERLFAQGRTTPGKIVTNVRGGDSFHNHRVAFDFARNVRGREFDNSDNFFDRVGAIWRQMGGVWGGDWTRFVDRPHCEFTDGKPVSWFKAGNTLDGSLKMRWEQ